MKKFNLFTQLNEAKQNQATVTTPAVEDIEVPATIREPNKSTLSNSLDETKVGYSGTTGDKSVTIKVRARLTSPAYLAGRFINFEFNTKAQKDNYKLKTSTQLAADEIKSRITDNKKSAITTNIFSREFINGTFKPLLESVSTRSSKGRQGSNVDDADVVEVNKAVSSITSKFSEQYKEIDDKYPEIKGVWSLNSLSNTIRRKLKDETISGQVDQAEVDAKYEQLKKRVDEKVELLSKLVLNYDSDSSEASAFKSILKDLMIPEIHAGLADMSEDETESDVTSDENEAATGKKANAIVNRNLLPFLSQLIRLENTLINNKQLRINILTNHIRHAKTDIKANQVATEIINFIDSFIKSNSGSVISALVAGEKEYNKRATNSKIIDALRLHLLCVLYIGISYSRSQTKQANESDSFEASINKNAKIFFEAEQQEAPEANEVTPDEVKEVIQVNSNDKNAFAIELHKRETELKARLLNTIKTLVNRLKAGTTNKVVTATYSNLVNSISTLNSSNSNRLTIIHDNTVLILLSIVVQYVIQSYASSKDEVNVLVNAMTEKSSIINKKLRDELDRYNIAFNSVTSATGRSKSIKLGGSNIDNLFSRLLASMRTGSSESFNGTGANVNTAVSKRIKDGNKVIEQALEAFKDSIDFDIDIVAKKIFTYNGDSFKLGFAKESAKSIKDLPDWIPPEVFSKAVGELTYQFLKSRERWSGIDDIISDVLNVDYKAQTLDKLKDE